MYSLKAPKQNKATYTNVSDLFCTMDLGPLADRVPISGILMIDVTKTATGDKFLKQLPTLLFL